MVQRSERLSVLALAAHLVKRMALSTQEYFGLLLATARASFTQPFYFRDVVRQMDTIGVSSLAIVLLTGLFTGMVLALQAAVEMERYGATLYIGRVVGASAVRELGPVLTALMVTGRAGSGMAAQIGAMRVTEQIDALDTMGVDPIRKLVVPRVLAGLVVMPMLTVIADITAILGGLLVAVVKFDLTFDLFMRGVYLTMSENGFVFRYMNVDLLSGLLKPVAFGGIMALTSSFYGLRTRGGTEGVGQATTHAVVTTSVLILASDYFLTQLLITMLIQR
ncbi:MAG: MlaE family ABC transporter permease [Gemmatimonadota bacterium]